MPNKDYSKIRRYMDGDDPFVTGGHQIIKTAGATLHTQRVQCIPAWTRNDDEVRKLLQTAFPKLNEDSRVGRRQREWAARWLRVIHLYCRVGWTRAKVADELGVKPHIIRLTYQRICRVYKGLRSDGKPRVQSGSGRPKI